MSGKSFAVRSVVNSLWFIVWLTFLVFGNHRQEVLAFVFWKKFCRKNARQGKEKDES